MCSNKVVNAGIIIIMLALSSCGKAQNEPPAAEAVIKEEEQDMDRNEILSLVKERLGIDLSAQISEADGIRSQLPRPFILNGRGLQGKEKGVCLLLSSTGLVD